MSLFRPLRLYGVLLASLGVVIAVALFTPVADDALTRTAYGWRLNVWSTIWARSMTRKW